MKKALAIALLDFRRLGFGLASAALIAGLIPALASGLGGKVSVVGLVSVAFFLVGAITGGTFGGDFSDGKSSFFFARPLPTGVLLAGRFAALLALAASVFFAFMASFWISSSDRSEWSLSVLTLDQLLVLLSAWAVFLFIGLAGATRGRGVRAEGGVRAMVMIPVRLILSMVAFLFVFGLFADLLVRAHFGGFNPIKVFVLSWVAACFVASCAAMEGGRTERGGIKRLQGRVMAAHFALVTVVVAAAWTWVLHPGPGAIQAVSYPIWGSADGRTAYVSGKVGRGFGSSFDRRDGVTFSPIFILDIASGQAQRLNADQYQGPWLSKDGGTMVWSEATPFFFRPLWRRMGGTTTFRVKTTSGQVSLLPMPDNAPDYRTVRDLTYIGTVDWVTPSPDGDVFAIQWDRHLTFTSRSRGQLSEINEYKDYPKLSRGINLASSVFLPTGDLRASRILRNESGAQTLTFVDIDPRSGSMKTVASLPVEGGVFVQLDEKGGRALLTSSTQPGRGAFVALVDLSGAGGEVQPTILLKGVMQPTALFMSDGRIAASTGGSVGEWQKRTLKIFSAAGQADRDIPIGDGPAPRLGREMFPGILAVRVDMFKSGLSLIDTRSGDVVRKIPDMDSIDGFFLRGGAPPGTPAARLLQSKDGKLYELPSITAEPRLLLPRS